MSPAVPVPASTLTILRERKGIEVYLTRRNANLVFLGGYHVFPGGRRDEDDFSEAAIKRMHAASLKLKAEQVESREPQAQRLGYYSAAVREAFEEAGILIACQRGGGRIKPGRELKKELARERSAIHAGRITFLQMLEQFDFAYDLDRLFWYARWVTPEFSPRRFDTQFFAAALPRGQRPAGFPEEVDDEFWVRPEDALAQWRAGKLAMIPPTAASLATLANFSNLKQLRKKWGKK